MNLASFFEKKAQNLHGKRGPSPFITIVGPRTRTRRFDMLMTDIIGEGVGLKGGLK